ncbi:cysteine-rich CWC family protein [Ectopseudomonas mendocina]|uniref:cysteine-rich CWC family protein n=1 Tax=Ectopseudomonas mendocina TaxID=300 RepID=UPI003F01B57F
MDTQHCPLCGKSNQCSVAAGLDEACWCFDAQIDPAALQRLTPEQRNQACLCPACAGALKGTEPRERD